MLIISISSYRNFIVGSLVLFLVPTLSVEEYLFYSDISRLTNILLSPQLRIAFVLSIPVTLSIHPNCLQFILLLLLLIFVWGWIRLPYSVHCLVLQSVILYQLVFWWFYFVNLFRFSSLAYREIIINQALVIIFLDFSLIELWMDSMLFYLFSFQN